MNKLPANVRVMMIIVGFPFLAVLALVLYKLFMGEVREIGYGAVVLSIVGIFMYYIAISGRLTLPEEQDTGSGGRIHCNYFKY